MLSIECLGGALIYTIYSLTCLSSVVDDVCGKLVVPVADWLLGAGDLTYTDIASRFSRITSRSTCTSKYHFTKIVYMKMVQIYSG